MRPASRAKARGRRFKHQSLGDRDAAQSSDLRRGHNAGIEVRQQARLLKDQSRHDGEIGNRRIVPERLQFIARDAIAQFRLVTECKKRLAASSLGARFCDGEHLIRTQISAPAVTRRMGEGAIMTGVAA